MYKVGRVNCPCPEQGRTRPKSEQPTFKCNICFNSTHRTSRSQSNHSQELCEWFGHDLQVLFVKLEQISHLKVDCSDFGLIRPCSGQGQLPLPLLFFGPVRDRSSLPYLGRVNCPCPEQGRNPNSQLQRRWALLPNILNSHVLLSCIGWW